MVYLPPVMFVELNCKSVVLKVTVIFSVAMGVRILFLAAVVLILFLRNSSSQSCHDHNDFEQQMSKEGYSRCPWVNHMSVSYTHLTLPTNREV